MTNKELADFLSFLDQDNLLGKNYIHSKIEEWKKIKPTYLSEDLAFDQVDRMPLTLTVGALRRIISESNLSDDSIVFIERVEDVYFGPDGWKTLKVENSLFDWMDEFIPATFSNEENGKLLIYCHY